MTKKRWVSIALGMFALLPGLGFVGMSGAARGVFASESDGRFPKTIQGERARAFFAALRSSNSQDYVRFGRDHRPASPDSEAVDRERTRQHGEFRDMWGSLEILRVEVEGPAELAVLAKASRDGMESWFRFEFDATEARKIVSIRIEHAEEPGAAIQDEDWETLADLLDLVWERSELPAIAAAVTHRGKIVDAAAVGTRKEGVAGEVQLGDTFHWGSVGKSVTGTAIGRLLQDGKLRPDLTVRQALPDYDVHPGFREVTLEQLMAHRGGVAPFTNFADLGRFADKSGDPVEVRAQFLKTVLAKAPIGTPGRTQRYSNAGIALAAHMAEVVVGVPWRKLVVDHVFTPAKMTTGGFGWPSLAGPDQPCGHRDVEGAFVPADPKQMPFSPSLAPAGNVRSSIQDLARYAKLHLDGLSGRDGYLTAETVKRLHRPLPGPGEPYAFGWGIMDWPEPGSECHWHNGSGGTYFAQVKLFPEEDLGIVVSMNAYRGAERAAEIIERALWTRYVSGD